MFENDEADDLDLNLWVLAKLQESVCAVKGAYVESILMMEKDVTALPDSDDVNIGVIHYRGDFLPIVDVRRLMGMNSRAQEQDEFEHMLEQRKQDHIRWVTELKRCLEAGEKFPLATDPHKCAFGKWYDSYRPNNHSVAFHLKKIDEPHKKLHATALEAFSCPRDCEHCTRSECLNIVLKKATDSYMPTVVALLEEAKQVFRDSYRKMVIVLADGVSSCGLLVDEVLSAEPLASFVKNQQMCNVGEHPIVTHIAQRKDDTAQVLVLNPDRLFKMESC